MTVKFNEQTHFPGKAFNIHLPNRGHIQFVGLHFKHKDTMWIMLILKEGSF
jgi:hypothetical protein